MASDSEDEGIEDLVDEDGDEDAEPDAEDDGLDAGADDATEEGDDVCFSLDYYAARSMSYFRRSVLRPWSRNLHPKTLKKLPMRMKTTILIPRAI